jgi:hypothetical protein
MISIPKIRLRITHPDRNSISTIRWDTRREASVGRRGYFYKQITNDKMKGVKVGEDGFRGQVFAIGPKLNMTTGI